MLWRRRYKLSLRDVAELFVERGFVVTHETAREWETRCAPLLAEQVRTRQHGQAGACWHVDETSLKIHGKWCDLYRALDQDGRLVDSMVSERRNREAAQRFDLRRQLQWWGTLHIRVTTDGHRSSPRAICETMGSNVLHRTKKYLNTQLEQDHRGIKERYSPMRGFGNLYRQLASARAAPWVKPFHERINDG